MKLPETWSTNEKMFASEGRDMGLPLNGETILSTESAEKRTDPR